MAKARFWIGITALSTGLITAFASEAPRLVCTSPAIGDLSFSPCPPLRARLLEQKASSPIQPVPRAVAEEMVRQLTSPSEVKVNGSGSVKVMAQNIGTAAFRWKRTKFFLPGLEKNCPNFKLCDPKIIQIVAENIRKVQPDVIFFAEARSEDQLLRGDEYGGPVLPAHYDAVCTFGHMGVQETCLAWNTESAQLTGQCKSVIGLESGVISCPLSVGGTRIQFVSAHPSAWVKEERQAILEATWAKLIDRASPVIIGGDFNTEDGTFGFSKEKPYPAEFGTLFGRHVKSYGRWSAADSFFGHYHSDSFTPSKPHSHRTTTLTTKIDHVFANFGSPENLKPQDNACGSYSCLAGIDEGFLWDLDHWSFGSTVGSKIDHRPILTRLKW
jgi:hypothetical protein